MNNKKIQEILTYEVYQKEHFEIWIPVQKIMEPRFLIKQKDLYIFLYNYEQSYLIKNIPDTIIQEIIKKNAVLVESLSETRVKHPIRMYP